MCKAVFLFFIFKMATSIILFSETQYTFPFIQAITAIIQRNKGFLLLTVRSSKKDSKKANIKEIITSDE